MNLSKYRFVKQMEYKNRLYTKIFVEDLDSRIMKFIEENNLATGDLLCFDLRLVLEKQATDDDIIG